MTVHNSNVHKRNGENDFRRSKEENEKQNEKMPLTHANIRQIETKMLSGPMQICTNFTFTNWMTWIFGEDRRGGGWLAGPLGGGREVGIVTKTNISLGYFGNANSNILPALLSISNNDGKKQQQQQRRLQRNQFAGLSVECFIEWHIN